MSWCLEVRQRILLLDGDTYRYKYGFATQPAAPTQVPSENPYQQSGTLSICKVVADKEVESVQREYKLHALTQTHHFMLISIPGHQEPLHFQFKRVQLGWLMRADYDDLVAAFTLNTGVDGFGFIASLLGKRAELVFYDNSAMQLTCYAKPWFSQTEWKLNVLQSPSQEADLQEVVVAVITPPSHASDSAEHATGSGDSILTPDGTAA